MPTPIRAKNRVKKLLAIPQAAVIALQTATPSMISFCRDQRSATHASGIPITV
jgi:hypothetical protein